MQTSSRDIVALDIETAAEDTHQFDTVLDRSVEKNIGTDREAAKFRGEFPADAFFLISAQLD